MKISVELKHPEKLRQFTSYEIFDELRGIRRRPGICNIEQRGTSNAYFAIRRINRQDFQNKSKFEVSSKLHYVYTISV